MPRPCSCWGCTPQEQLLTCGLCERNERRDAPWRVAFVLVFAALALGALLIPGPSDAKLLRALSGVCARQHNIVPGEMKLLLCARDTGIYLIALLVRAGA